MVLSSEYVLLETPVFSIFSLSPQAEIPGQTKAIKSGCARSVHPDFQTDNPRPAGTSTHELNELTTCARSHRAAWTHLQHPVSPDRSVGPAQNFGGKPALSAASVLVQRDTRYGLSALTSCK